MITKFNLHITSAVLAVVALAFTIIAFVGVGGSHSVAGVIGAVCLVTSVLLDLAADRIRN